MLAGTTPLEREFNNLLEQSISASKEERITICDKLRDCIRRGISLYSEPIGDWYSIPLLWRAIARIYPLEIIECLYKESPEATKVIIHGVSGYNHSETRLIYYPEYDIQLFLASQFDSHFIHMCDDDVDYIEYALACLKIINIQEKDMDWAIQLKYGRHD